MTVSSSSNSLRRRWRLPVALVCLGVLLPAAAADRGLLADGPEGVVPAVPTAGVADATTAKARVSPESGASEAPVPRELASLVGADSYFVPISPFRMYDSRNSDGWWLSGDDYVVEALSDERGMPMLPAATTAVAFNVTVAQTGSAGFVQIYGPGTDAFSTSSVNWSFTGISLANSGVSMLGDSGGQPGYLSVALGGLADAGAYIILDITGYYLPL